MNLNHLINMVTNQVIRRVVNIVVDRGIALAWRKKPASEQPPEKHVTTPAELAKEARLQAMADQAAKTAKMARRLGR
jgi:hypothetical protein